MIISVSSAKLAATHNKKIIFLNSVELMLHKSKTVAGHHLEKF